MRASPGSCGSPCEGRGGKGTGQHDLRTPDNRRLCRHLLPNAAEMPPQAVGLALLEALGSALHAPEQPGVRGDALLESGSCEQQWIDLAPL